jgi:hypothetical protein
LSYLICTVAYKVKNNGLTVKNLSPIRTRKTTDLDSLQTQGQEGEKSSEEVSGLADLKYSDSTQIMKLLSTSRLTDLDFTHFTNRQVTMIDNYLSQHY